MKTQIRKRQFTSPLATTLALALTASTIPHALADDYDSICGSGQTVTGQKASYCAAAKQAKDASKKETVLTGLYAAVAGTCWVACSTDIFSGGTGDIACSGGALAAGVGEMIATKNFSNSFNVLVGGLGLMNALDSAKKADGLVADVVGDAMKKSIANGEVASGTKAVSSAATTKIGSFEVRTACITAATTSVSTLMHAQSTKNAKSTYDQNLASAKKVNDSDTSGYTAPPSLVINNHSGATNGTPSTGSTATNLGSGSGNTASATGDACGDTGSTGGAIACATAGDPNLANMVANPDFQKGLQKASGMNLDDYLKGASNLSASDAIKAAAGAGLGGSQMDTLTKSLAKAEEAAPYMNGEVTGGTYAASAGHSSGASGNDDFANMMSGLMGKLMPKTDADKKSGVSEVKFGAPARNLASVTAEDPTVSLFERVAYRYSHVTPRLLSEPAKRTLSDWSGSAPSAPSAPSVTKKN